MIFLTFAFRRRSRFETIWGVSCNREKVSISWGVSWVKEIDEKLFLFFFFITFFPLENGISEPVLG